MLQQSNFLQDTCEIVSGLFNVVITIVDKEFIRIAGTDRYKGEIGRQAANPNVFKKVMENDRTIIINSPGNEEICGGCVNKNNCPEKAAIYTPLEVKGEIIGGLGIMAFNEEQKRSGLFKEEVFLKFTEKLGQLISSKIEAQEYARMLNINLKETVAIINSVHDGVIAVNGEGRIYQINDSASAYFGMEKETYLNQNISQLLSQPLVDRLKRNRNFVDVEDKIIVNHTKIHALITAQRIEEEGQVYGTVLIFKSIKEASSIARKLLHEADYKVSFEDIIGESQALHNVKYLSKTVAGSDSTVLIRGESGTGKEMFARAIHNDSRRREGPFIPVNCAAIPEPLLESELFGYDDGAFTGAKKGGKIGKCELASGGTLFLDEVGDIPLFLQSKFLRMLQERAIERVGGTKTIPVDIRIIAATNRNLEEMIERREYREDLYYRLNVIPIFLPPLRERKDDILTVSDYFLSHYTKRLNKRISAISSEARHILYQYAWPGNLRELENAIECAVNIENSRELTVGSLPERIRKESGALSPKASAADGSAWRGFSTNSEEVQNGGELPPTKLKKRMRKVEIQEVIKALDRYGWNTKGKKVAAKNLGIGIATLYRILNQ